ncbi:hypothetical protein BV22DRAFT_1034583 [Leucogyrophana mollusca]|uniref:Uncharacterized protein n=1 Tax=Leucogyrophana mollusca TaxID=85980 RepID=A0ACB8BJG9_9AGAM|nr:hypothetical protein BV22DRAFT_1034583 [Leucogyrophana mollusca]
MSGMDVPVSASSLQTNKYCRVAPAALWGLDYCLMFDDEIHFMQRKGRLNVAHVLFVVTRYLPLTALFVSIYGTLTHVEEHEMCVTLCKASAALSCLPMMAAEGLLFVRQRALWLDNKKALVFLASTYSALLVFLTVSMTYACVFWKIDIVLSLPTLDCLTSTSTILNDFTIGIMSGIAFFELVVLCMTLLWGYLSNVTDFPNISRLINTFCQGNIMHALALLSFTTSNIVFIAAAPHSGLSGSLDMFQVVVHSVMASRILFSLRNASDMDGEVEAMSLSASQCAPLVFAEHANSGCT